jgi:hypothetical protein
MQPAGGATAKGKVDLDSRAKSGHDSQCFSLVPAGVLLNLSQLNK